MKNYPIIYFVRTTNDFFYKWEYYLVDLDMLKSTYSSVLVSHNFLSTIKLLIKYKKADVFCWWWHSSFPVIFLAYLFKRRIFCTGAIHMFDYSQSNDYYKNSYFYRFITNLSLKLSTFNLFISNDQYLSITSHLKVTNPLILHSSLSLQTTNSPISRDQIYEYAPSSNINLLFIGWLTRLGIERKCLLQILEALNISLYQRNISLHLTIAGRPSDGLEILLNKIERLDLKQHVTLLYDIEQSTKELQYKKSDLFVSPSYMEGFGNASLEAMSFGCPAIVSRFGASHEVVGNTGYIINTINSLSISDAIADYNSLDYSKRKKKRLEAFDRAHKKFSFYKRLNRFHQIIKEIA